MGDWAAQGELPEPREVLRSENRLRVAASKQLPERRSRLGLSHAQAESQLACLEPLECSRREVVVTRCRTDEGPSSFREEVATGTGVLVVRVYCEV